MQELVVCRDGWCVAGACTWGKEGGKVCKACIWCLVLGGGCLVCFAGTRGKKGGEVLKVGICNVAISLAEMSGKDPQFAQKLKAFMGELQNRRPENCLNKNKQERKSCE